MEANEKKTEKSSVYIENYCKRNKEFSGSNLQHFWRLFMQLEDNGKCRIVKKILLTEILSSKIVVNDGR